jgi:hypothetical protein
MPLTMTTVTGPVYLPNGATPLGGRVSFELSSWDVEDASGLVITGPVYAEIDENGQFSVNLFTSTAGTNSVTYRMFVIWEDSTLAQSYVNDIYVSHPVPHYTKKFIGSFVLSGPGPFQLSELNIVSEVNNSTFDAYLEVKAFADRIDLTALDQAVATSQGAASSATASASSASASAISATASEANAATSETNAAISETNAAISETNAAASALSAAEFAEFVFNDLPDLMADDTLTYTLGQLRTVVVDDYVYTRNQGFVYKVAASGATDHHLSTTGGVKLYVVFNGVLYVEQFAPNTIPGTTDMADAVMAIRNWLVNEAKDFSVQVDLGGKEVGIGRLLYLDGVTGADFVNGRFVSIGDSADYTSLDNVPNQLVWPDAVGDPRPGPMFSVTNSSNVYFDVVIDCNGVSSGLRFNNTEYCGYGPKTYIYNMADWGYGCYLLNTNLEFRSAPIKVQKRDFFDTGRGDQVDRNCIGVHIASPDVTFIYPIANYCGIGVFKEGAGSWAIMGMHPYESHIEVLDAGEPLAAVGLYIKNPGNGTVTDAYFDNAEVVVECDDLHSTNGKSMRFSNCYSAYGGFGSNPYDLRLHTSVANNDLGGLLINGWHFSNRTTNVRMTTEGAGSFLTDRFSKKTIQGASTVKGQPVGGLGDEDTMLAVSDFFQIVTKSLLNSTAHIWANVPSFTLGAAGTPEVSFYSPNSMSLHADPENNSGVDGFLGFKVGNFIAGKATRTGWELNGLTKIANLEITTSGTSSSQLNSALVVVGSIQNRAFSARSELVAAMVTDKAPDGYKVFIGEVAWEYNSAWVGDGTISDLPGMHPYGPASPLHWQDNTTPGTTNMTAAIQSAFDYGTVINVSLPGGVLLISDTITVRGKDGTNALEWMSVRGAGMQYTRIRQSDHTKDHFDIKKAEVDFFGWLCGYFGGMTLESINVMKTSKGTALRHNRCLGVVFEDLLIAGPTNCISSDGSAMCWYHRVFTRGTNRVAGQSQDSIYIFTDNGNNRSFGNFMYNCEHQAGQQTDRIFDLQGLDGLYVSNSHFNNGIKRVHIRPDNAAWRSKIFQVMFDNVYWDGDTSPTDFMFVEATFHNEWVTATSYTLDDQVIYNDMPYTCILGHTSGASTEPGIGASWATNWVVSPGWVTDTSYALEQTIRYGGVTYVCVRTHTSSEPGAVLATGNEPGVGQVWTTYWKVFEKIRIEGVYNHGGFIRVSTRSIFKLDDTAAGLRGLKNLQEIHFKDVDIQDVGGVVVDMVTAHLADPATTINGFEFSGCVIADTPAVAVPPVARANAFRLLGRNIVVTNNTLKGNWDDAGEHIVRVKSKSRMVDVSGNRFDVPRTLSLCIRESDTEMVRIGPNMAPQYGDTQFFDNPLRIGNTTGPGLLLDARTSTTDSDIAIDANGVIGAKDSLTVAIEGTGHFAVATGVTDYKEGTTGSTERFRVDSSGIDVTGRLLLNDMPIGAATVTVANGAVGLITLPGSTKNAAFVVVHCKTEGGDPQNVHGGLARIDAGTTPAAFLVSGGANFAVTTGTLSGTSGAATFTTISPNSSRQIQIENQSGATRIYEVVML